MTRDPSRTESVWRPFQEIAPTYDLVNRIVSFGRDRYWRRLLANRVASTPHTRVLDLAAGTGDVLLAIAGIPGFNGMAVGADLAGEMLAIGRAKVSQAGLSHCVSLLRSDAMQTALGSEALDVVTMAFGLRNVAGVDECLREIHRLLRPGGKVFILEFSLPVNGWVRMLHLLYLRHVLPLIGGLISGNLEAYRYLNSSIEAFPFGESLCTRMRDAGFTDARHTPLTFGVATLYEGTRPATAAGN